MNIYDIFDSWEPLMKARKAKGLDNWAKLQGIAGKLQGKGVDAISFTCSHPSHATEPVRHLLGSVEGNLHFLMGYGNPSFHLAPYHFQVMDPNLTEEEAMELAKRMGNPSNPALWAKAGLSVGDEGDTAEGEAHSQSKQSKQQQVIDKKRNEEMVPAISPTGKYVCLPSEGIVTSERTGHVYRWDLAKDTFFSAQNPEATAVMDEAAVTKSLVGIRYRSAVPDRVRAIAKSFAGESFVPSVYPLVKSRVPGPGYVMNLESKVGETIYGVVTPTSIEFYDREAALVAIPVFDRVYKSLELVVDGSVPPASVFSFLVKHFKVNTELLKEVAAEPVLLKSISNFVVGEPSPGYDDVPSEYTEGRIR